MMFAVPIFSEGFELNKKIIQHFGLFATETSVLNQSQERRIDLQLKVLPTIDINRGLVYNLFWGNEKIIFTSENPLLIPPKI